MKVLIKSYGCSTNFSHSEIMAGLLENEGFEIVDNEKDANIVLINPCTVKGENNAVREIRKITKPLFIVGCITDELIKKVKEIKKDAVFADTHNVLDIAKIITKKKNQFGYKKKKKINFPKKRRNNVIGIVPISEGCNQYCAYCSVRLIKGELFSYPKESIIEEVKQCLKDGCNEIRITSQDTAAYMTEHGKSKLPELLDEITKIKGDFLVRVGMMNPGYVKPITKELIEAFKSKKIFKFLHLPAQSGNDKILKLMKRNYKVRDFISIINRFRKEIPDITISTDIICGFPTETKQQFMDSVKLIRKIKPDVLNISRYQKRKGTEAASLKQIHGRDTKNRSRILTEKFALIALERNKKWVGWKGKILINEKRKGYVGRNYCYKPIIIQNGSLGSTITIEIIAARKNYLFGKKINDESSSGLL